jgi:hypothetical protein
MKLEVYQMIYTGMFLMSMASFDQGMNTYIFIFYREAAFGSFDCSLIIVIIFLIESNSKVLFEFPSNSNPDLYLNFHSNYVVSQTKWSA